MSRTSTFRVSNLPFAVREREIGLEKFSDNQCIVQSISTSMLKLILTFSLFHPIPVSEVEIPIDIYATLVIVQFCVSMTRSIDRKCIIGDDWRTTETFQFVSSRTRGRCGDKRVEMGFYLLFSQITWILNCQFKLLALNWKSLLAIRKSPFIWAWYFFCVCWHNPLD